MHTEFRKKVRNFIQKLNVMERIQLTLNYLKSKSILICLLKPDINQNMLSDKFIEVVNPKMVVFFIPRRDTSMGEL